MMDMKAEVFFLIVKLLEDEGCISAAESLKKFIDDKKLLPARINTVGVPFDNTYDNYDSLHNLSKPSVLVEYYQLLVKLVNDGNKCASHLKTLIGIQNKVEKAFSTRRIDFHTGLKDHNKSRKSLLSNLHHHSKLQFHILAHRTAIYCLEFDRRGNYVFTGSDDYTIKIWSVKGSRTPSCTLRHTLRGHVAEIIELTISIDNHLLASIDSNCCLVIWCLKTGQPVVSVRGSRNNRVLSGLGFLNVPGTVGSITEVSPNSNDTTHPSGMLIVSSFGGYLHIIPYIHTVNHVHHEDEFGNAINGFENRWICCTVQLLPTIRFTTAPEGTPNVFWPSIACIDVSPGGLLIAAGCSDQRIRLYQFTNPLKPELAGVLAAHEESVNSVAFSHCGLKLATGSSDGGSCWLWKFQAGQWRSMTLPFRKRVKCRPCLLVWSIHDQYLIASMKNGSVYIYFGHSGQLVTIIEGHEGAIHAVSPSPFDENILATGGVDGRFQLWNISNLRRFQQHHDEDGNHMDYRLSTDKPLLFHYRFPPGDLDIMQGLVWRFDDPPNDQPIWSGANITTTHRRTIRDNSNIPQISALDPSVHLIDSQNDGITSSINNNANHASSYHTLTGSRSLLNNSTTRTGSVSNTKMQRITACRVIPSIEGVGFLVVTKSVNNNISHSPNSNNDSNRIVHYTPPPAVLYEIIHAPSGVPFHRLPPGYLTNLRGLPYPPKRQLAVPGRTHLVQLLDLLPSLTLDEETGEDIVVDDIQFCSSVPMDYCPAPQLSSSQPMYGKNYLWCSPWLTNKTPLIEPLDGEELNSKILEQQQRYEDERNFFSAGGEPVVSFGDEFNISKHSAEQVVIMQPERNCFRQSQVSPLKSSFPVPLSVSSIPESVHCKSEIGRDSIDASLTSGLKVKNEIDVSMEKSRCPNQVNYASNQVGELNNSSTIAGPSFLHTYLMKAREDEVNSTNTLRVSTRSATIPRNKPNQVSNSIIPPMDEQDDADDQDDSSEESEWSAHIDVDIGWWSRQRRRRTRRHVNTNDVVIVTNDAEQINPNILSDTEMDLDNDEIIEDETSVFDAGELSLSSAHTETNQNASNTESSIRRSLRQRRRLLVKRRLMREEKKAEARAARAEIERKYSGARRSQRFLNLTGNDCGRTDEDSTSRDTCLGVSSSRSQSTETVTPTLIDMSTRRERLKRRLVRSLDYAVTSITTGIRTCSKLPLTRIPSDCYLSPDCEYQAEKREESELNKNRFIIPNIDVGCWNGPYFDWLSTIRPSASPFLPQCGDRVVYLYRGHQDYLLKVWECGNLPLIDNLNHQKSNYSTLLPWTVWPDLPQFLCCSVQKITYHIVRIAGNHSNTASCSSIHYEQKTRKHSNTAKRLQQSQQLISLKDLNLSCSKEHKSPTTASISSCFLNKRHSMSPTSLDSNVCSSSLSDDGDSFVRLITLELKVEDNQPYATLNYEKIGTKQQHHNDKQQQNRPKILYVTYHDVDGILEFIILRRLFDASLTRKWKPGDLFVCPVGDLWWRGVVIRNLSENDLSTPQSSTSKVDTGDSVDSLNTTYLVRWLDKNEPSAGSSSCCNTITDTYLLNNLLTLTDFNSSLDNLPDNIDNLNSWDIYTTLYNVYYRIIISQRLSNIYTFRSIYSDSIHGLSFSLIEFVLFGSLTDGNVHISHEQICFLYGTSKFWDTSNHSTTYLSEVERLVECITQIMQLDISEQFVNPVNLAAYPDYLFINAFPVDLSFILNQSLKSDFIQLLENTERYNLPASSIVRNAQLSDVLRQYERLISSNIPSRNLDCDRVTATTSSYSVNDRQNIEKRARIRTSFIDRKQKICFIFVCSTDVNFASSSCAPFTIVRTSSGRVVRPPQHSSQNLSSSFSDDYDQKYDCSYERKKSRQHRRKLNSCSSGNSVHSVNKLHSRYTDRKCSIAVNQSKSIKVSNSSEDLSNTSLRRSTRKRKVISGFSHFYGSEEGNDEFE
ncbi:PH-interacting protein [Schistosoma japonicum]|nr:PH-interacting protein [Schistosoma japonicum]